MMELWHEAGTAFLFIVITGFCALGFSVAFAYRPTLKKRRVTDAFLRVTLFESAFGFIAGMIGTCHAVQSAFEHGYDKWWQILIIGTRESANNLLAGLAFLSLTALFVAVGEARAKPTLE